MVERALRFGEGLTYLHVRSNRNPRFATSSLGGRFLLICAVTDLSRPNVRAALRMLGASRFDEVNRAALLLCADPTADKDELVAETGKVMPVLFDDGAAMKAWRLGPLAGTSGGHFILFDPTTRALAFWKIEQAAPALAALAATPEPAAHAGVPLHAPVLIVPRVFEPAFCEALIKAYNFGGSEDSGTTRENADGKTYVALDHTFKRRRDHVLTDKILCDGAMHRIFWRLIPEIEKAFMRRMTRMERYIVSCYDAETGGYFRAHRDNTTKGTAHRRFALTINLNAEDYDGGDLRFPEFGSRTYRAPTGGAVVFGCGLLHEATPVTRGRRYAFLPFLYDEEAMQLRAENARYLDESLKGEGDAATSK